MPTSVQGQPRTFRDYPSSYQTEGSGHPEAVRNTGYITYKQGVGGSSPPSPTKLPPNWRSPCRNAGAFRLVVAISPNKWVFRGSPVPSSRPPGDTRWHLLFILLTHARKYMYYDSCIELHYFDEVSSYLGRRNNNLDLPDKLLACFVSNIENPRNQST